MLEKQKIKERFKQHSEKDWFKHVNCLAIEPYESNAIASEREAELINVLTPLFNKQGGLGMSFKKQKKMSSLQVPKMADVTNITLCAYKDVLQNTIKLWRQQNIMTWYC